METSYDRIIKDKIHLEQISEALDRVRSELGKILYKKSDEVKVAKIVKTMEKLQREFKQVEDSRMQDLPPFEPDKCSGCWSADCRDCGNEDREY